MLRRVLIGVCVVLAIVGVAGTYGAYRLFHRAPGAYFYSGEVPIYYTDEGEGAPVILVHGLAVNADLNWRIPGVTGLLAQHFRVIALDQRGHGESGKPHDPAAFGDMMCEDIVRLMDELKIPKAHVVGYSLGGYVTLKLAVLHPDRLLSIGVLGAGWESPEKSPTLNFLSRTRAKASGRSSGPGAELPDSRIGDRVMGWLNDRQSLAAVMQSVPAFALTEAQVKAITLPICVIAGERDLERGAAERLRDTAPNVTYTMVPGAGHLQAPGRKELQEALLAFLKAQPEPKPDEAKPAEPAAKDQPAP